METLIVIRLYTAQDWLYKLGYEYKDIYKDIFIDVYEQTYVIEDCKIFLKKIKELKPYMIEFDKFDIIKPKVYLLDCAREKAN